MPTKIKTWRATVYDQFYLDDLKKQTGMNHTQIIHHAILLMWSQDIGNKEKTDQQPGPETKGE